MPSFLKAAGKGMSKSTLHRLNNKIDLIDPNTYKFKRSHHNRQVFTPKQECDLVDYLIVAQKIEPWSHASRHKKTSLQLCESQSNQNAT